MSVSLRPDLELDRGSVGQAVVEARPVLLIVLTPRRPKSECRAVVVHLVPEDLVPAVVDGRCADELDPRVSDSRV
jgi:hypothetical protein